MATRSQYLVPVTGTYVDALISGGQWDTSSGKNLTVSIANNVYGSSADSYIPDANYLLFTLGAIANDIQRFLPISFSINNSILINPTYSPSNITISSIWMGGPDAAYLGLNSNYLGIAECPDSVTSTDVYRLNTGVDVIINENQLTTTNLTPGKTGYYTLYHELGHALGLKHPFDGGPFNYPTFSQLGLSQYDKGVITTMSYENPANYSVDGYGAPASYMVGDILALQQIYGKRNDYNSGENTYDISSFSTIYNDIWFTLYDCGGSDTLNANSSLTGWKIYLSEGVAYTSDMRNGVWFLSNNSTISSIFNASEISYENAIGSAYADTITGSYIGNIIEAGAGDDILDGKGGNDTLGGGGGNDVIDGGDGDDIVLFAATRAASTITKNANGSYTIGSSSDGFDTLTNVEYVQFSDQTISLTKNMAPIITSVISATTPENVTTSTAVYTAIAADPDAGTTLAYSLSGGADAGLFNISATTGAVTFKASPNFEGPADAGANNVYDIVVQASDGSLTATKAVAITVINVNEVPSITSTATATTAENVSTSTAVYTVAAYDADANTTLTYSISGGADASLFNINSSTGAVTFKASSNFEAPSDAGANNVYDIIMQASDGSLTSTKPIASNYPPPCHGL